MDGGKDAAIGFFTTEFSEGIGLTGGYLLLNLSGRPLEFHCTLPVKPSRAHTILYGQTLRPHLIGERIGPALLDRTRITPILICIDDPDAEGVQTKCNSPLVFVHSEANQKNNRPTLAIHGDEHSETDLLERLRPVARDAASADAVRMALAKLSEPIDLSEPFQRIREALREAQQSASRAA